MRGRPVRLRSPAAAIKAGIVHVPEDRKRDGILPTRSVQHNLSAGWMDRICHLGVVDGRREHRMATSAVGRFDIRAASLSTRIVQLSGGNQQKVVLGRWFALEPQVVVLSEPTRGIDVGAKSEVYRLIQDMAERGSAILVVSSELPELLGLTDRIVVMFRRRICAEFATSAATEEELAHAALGGSTTHEEGTQ